LPLGPVDGFREILRGGLRDRFPIEHEPLLDQLINEGLVSEIEEPYQVCTNKECRSFNREVIEKNLLSISGTCIECCEDLATRKKATITRNDSIISKAMRVIVFEAANYKKAKAPTSSISREEITFFRIEDESDKSKRIYAVFVPNLDKHTEQVIDRFSEPVVVFHLFGDSDRIFYDPSKAIVHVDFSYAITSIFKKDSQEDNEASVWNDFGKEFRYAFQQVHRGKSLRIKKSAECSRERIQAIPKDNKGNLFEIDVFNLIKAIFHHSSQWGGPRRPDGFSTLCYFKNNNLSDESKFLWSYDAKYSNALGGYKFTIDEKRKVRDYVMGILDQKTVNTQRNKYLAHVIIANNIPKKPLEECVDYLREEKVFEKSPCFNLVLMKLDFLLAIYDEAMKNYDEMKKRPNYLSEYVVEAMGAMYSRGNLVVLDAAKAKQIIAKVIKQIEVETPPDMDQIKENMK
jgi:hypothetical protein